MKKHSTIKTTGLLALIIVGGSTLCLGGTWSTRIDFSEFENSATGGFQNEGFTAMTLRSQMDAEAEQYEYDVLRRAAEAGTGFEEGQDGQMDMSVRATVIGGNEGRWTALEAQKRRDTFRGDGLVDAGTSRSGDYGLVVFEFDFASELKVLADDFKVRVTS